MVCREGLNRSTTSTPEPYSMLSWRCSSLFCPRRCKTGY